MQFEQSGEPVEGAVPIFANPLYKSKDLQSYPNLESVMNRARLIIGGSSNSQTPIDNLASESSALPSFEAIKGSSNSQTPIDNLGCM
jgi:hypothetical protein